MSVIIWIDEAWRWPWAWPVAACACILNKKSVKKLKSLKLLNDSKKLSKKQRETAYGLILEFEKNWDIIIWTWMKNNKIIDSVGIKEANRLAMEDALSEVMTKIWNITIEKVLIDWKDNYRFSCFSWKIEFIIKWDSKIDEIKAASICAKVKRDQIMMQYDTEFPWYGFSKHSWYWTKEHAMALTRLWACEIHRYSFAPIKKVLILEKTH